MKNLSVGTCVLIPFILIYAIDLLRGLLLVLQAVAIAVLLAYFAGFLFGTVAAMYFRFKGKRRPKLPDNRFFNLLPTIAIGYKCGDWLLEE